MLDTIIGWVNDGLGWVLIVTLLLAAGADLFLCEAGYIEGRDDHFTGVHLTGRRAGECAARAGVRAARAEPANLHASEPTWRACARKRDSRELGWAL